ncbi:M20 family metallo-hydrolase [Acetobacter tropicalis]|uniref:Zn-dependent hydrolase n=1 Tax=Acetobacter tropicalis TaxID=104102 RepID=A0A511FPW1_9PROT|nr:M20 family metallo-hydrolase [Acetobacter tropicalis]KXV49385.1 allantoate amidohydrolase [Acetobacter tropicalis]GEL50974.1 Zn-dependent hydrolase [Acetobacter tropicalis]
MVAQSNIVVDGAALWSDLMETAQFGATAKGGICRLALSGEDAKVRAWFKSTCEALGCVVSCDSMGNQFARRMGEEDGLAPIMIGSHLDTQPTGGKFDGILGVMGGIAVLRALRDAGLSTRHPIEIINWTNEEGARFTPPMLASGVFGGVFTQEFAQSRADRAGVRLGEALEEIGYVGAEVCGEHPAAAYFELHIEQGPVLEAEQRTIGVVQGVQGMRWYNVTVKGQDAHAGTTPMTMRSDALWGAARMIDAVHQVAMDHAPDGLGTVGIIDCLPGSSNVVPGEVQFTVDLRHPSDSVLEKMEEKFRQCMNYLATQCGVEMDITPTWVSAAVHFDPLCVECVRESAQALGYSLRDIVSGAGHDAVYVAQVAPTAMIFVPCWKGISHNEAESAEPEHVTAGANVLLHAILAADARLDA